MTKTFKPMKPKGVLRAPPDVQDGAFYENI